MEKTWRHQLNPAKPADGTSNVDEDDKTAGTSAACMHYFGASKATFALFFQPQSPPLNTRFKGLKCPTEKDFPA